MAELSGIRVMKKVDSFELRGFPLGRLVRAGGVDAVSRRLHAVVGHSLRVTLL